MSKQDCEQLTLFQEDSHASLLALPGSDEAVKTTVTSGLICSELSKNFGPLGSLEKTLLGSSIWRSTKCYLTWKAKNTKQGRLLFRLAVSMPRIEETGALLWHTPSAKEPGVKANRLVCKDGTPAKLGERAYDKDTGRLAQVGLSQQVQFNPLWPTPNSCKASMDTTLKASGDGRNKPNKLGWAVAMFPTPTTGAGLCCGTGNYRQLKALEASGEISEEERRSMASGGGGQLNPTWVEWLMGFPLGWTDLNASETP